MAAKKAIRRKRLQQPTPPANDESDQDLAEQESEQESEDDELDLEVKLDGERTKDQTEEELERLVFGDSAGFRDGLKDFVLDDDDDNKQEVEGGLDGLENADLFSYDVTGSNEAKVSFVTDGDVNSDDDEPARYRKPAAWEDSDDERLLVSLASVPRLRKLRRTQVEDVVNGKEYGKRLRRQFELLNPRPEWAQQAMQIPARKRRRLSGDEESGAESELSDEDMDTDGEVASVAPLTKLLQNTESLIRQSGFGRGKKRKIRPEVIQIQRAQDIPGIQPSAITSLSFHPRYPLLLSSGPSSTLYLHHIASSPPAPTPNPLLTSLHLSGTNLTTTAFHATDSRVFLSARRRYFHVWNLQTGRVERVNRIDGQQHEQRTMEKFKLSPDGSYMALLGSARKGGGIINVLSAATLQWVCQVRVESRGGIADFAWWQDGAGLCIAGKNGEVTEWSVHSRSIVARWQDEGAVGTTTLALGGKHDSNCSAIGSDRWIAIGSSSGITNIYDRSVWTHDPASKTTSTAKAIAAPGSSNSISPIPLQPKPTKTLDHLTTPISNLTFSPDGQILAMSSKWKKDSLRLVHLPSCTVFKNWPTGATALGRITGTAFCGGDILDVGGNGTASQNVYSVLAIANEQGKIRLWEIL
nr:putative u3 small nucleolar rna-associated protein 18 [Quercus suber]